MLVYTAKINTKSPQDANGQSELSHLQKSAQIFWKKKTQQHPLRGEWCQICSITFMEESQSHYYSNKNYQNLVSKEAESTGHFWSYLHGIFD